MPSNPPLRQEIYICALETLPNLSVHDGRYLQSTVSMPLAVPPSRGARFADVLKLEENGSEVDIATSRMVDAFRKDSDQRIVITNNSGLAKPVRIIKKELLIPVGVFNPQTRATAIRRNRVSGKPLRSAAPSIELKTG